MTLVDILARLSLGVFGFLSCVFLYVAFLVPIMRVGKFLDPEGSEYGQLISGFSALVVLSICGGAIWVLAAGSLVFYREQFDNHPKMWYNIHKSGLRFSV